MRRLIPGLLSLAFIVGTAQAAAAQAVRVGFANTPIPRGDDNYAPRNYGFNISYYGFVTSSAEVCTNGYVILNGYAPSSTTCVYPGPLSANSVPNLSGLRDFYGAVSSPFFADLNSALTGSGAVQTGSGIVNGNPAWAATWDGVFGYGAAGPNTFQLVLISLNAGGDFIMEFNYNQLALTAAGIGFTNDSPAIVANVSGNLRPQNTRIDCTFIQGSFTSCTSAVITPEPATVVLLGSGMLGLFGVSARRRRAESAI